MTNEDNTPTPEDATMSKPASRNLKAEYLEQLIDEDRDSMGEGARRDLDN
jgi:hypothetical protein